MDKITVTAHGVSDLETNFGTASIPLNDCSSVEDVSIHDDPLPTKKSSGCARNLMNCRSGLRELIQYHNLYLRSFSKFLCILAICVYLIFAFRHSFGSEDSIILLVVSILTVLCLVYSLICTFCMTSLTKVKERGENIRCTCRSKRVKTIVYWTILFLVMAPLILYILIDTAMKKPRNLLSLIGVFVLLAIIFLMSKHPDKVKWRVVIWGLLLQFFFGFLVIRTNWGHDSFEWFAKKLSQYLDHTKAGARFAFGNNYADHFFAFLLMPTIIMFSTTISVLYYLGVMRVFINAISFVIRMSLGTGPMETLHATFNIFVGWGETICVIRPLLDDMTLSELHAIMTNGFATVSGGTMAAYIIYGAPANHLVAASFMSAPAALALGKLMYPETKKNRTKMEIPEIVQSERGIVEAASAGAVSSIPVVAYIVVHVIAFVSILDFINSFAAWLGENVGIEPPDYPVLSFQYISSYLMTPVAFLMGVDLSDIRVSARMLGVKIFINEFIAFQDLGKVIRNNVALRNYTIYFPNNTWHWLKTDDVFLNASGETLIGGVMSERSSAITTYALCGFSDFIALGMMIGALSAAASSRKPHILKVAPRALFTGIVSNILTAAMAGLLME